MFSKLKFSKLWMVLVIVSSFFPSIPTFRDNQKLLEAFLEGYSRFMDTGEWSELHYKTDSPLTIGVWFLTLLSMLLFLFTFISSKINVYTTAVRVAAPLLFIVLQWILIKEILESTNILSSYFVLIVVSFPFYFCTFLLIKSLSNHYKSKKTEAKT